MNFSSRADSLSTINSTCAEEFDCTRGIRVTCVEVLVLFVVLARRVWVYSRLIMFSYWSAGGVLRLFHYLRIVMRGCFPTGGSYWGNLAFYLREESFYWREVVCYAFWFCLFMSFIYVYRTPGNWSTFP